MESGSEGFICPYCLVGFETSGKLQNHFVDMHSGQGNVDDYDEVEGFEEETCMDNNSPPPSVSPSPLGHQFQVIRQSRPKSCDTCNEIIWHDALVCQTCHVTVHMESCPDKLTVKCSPDVNCESLTSLDREQRVTGPGQNPKGLLPLVRRQVAKGRDRYVNDEFDLDLTYITERIIAMSFPATGVESAYRNNLKDVAKMLKTKHEDNYMVFNLSERSYDISRFNNQVLDFGWPDHLAPSLERLSSVCKSIKSWLDSEPLHVAVVHCKGGKGRTGCVIAAFMHYTEICHSAAAALDRFAMKRFYDNKMGGVTQPSQKKYVHYFSDLLSGVIDLQSPPVVLHHVLIHGIPNFDGKGGCRMFVKIYENMKLVHTSGLYVCSAEKERVKISIYGGLQLQGEVLLKCFHKKTHGMDSIFRCQFPSAIVKEDHRLVYKKADLDDAFKDKRFGEEIKVELLFSQSDDTNGDARDTVADLRSSLLESNRQSLSSGLAAVDLSHDRIANRDSYSSFPGGFDNGVPGEEVPDLMGHNSPDLATSRENSNRERSESSTSFQMDPGDIERVTHHSQVYTVISKPFKLDHDQIIKPSKLTSNMAEVSQAPQGSKYRPRKTSEQVANLPARPPPPNLLKKQSSAESVLSPTRPLAANRAPPSSKPPLPPSKPAEKQPELEEADYADVDDTSPTSSTDNSPFHRSSGIPLQIKQAAGNQAKKPADRILLDVHGSNQQHSPMGSPNRTPEHKPRPVPAARQVNQVPKPVRPPELTKENKKLELHQKYTKIREEILRKQGETDASGSGGSEGEAVLKLRQKLPRPPHASAGDNRPASSFMPSKPRAPETSVAQRPKPPKAHKLRSRPSYAEVEPDFEIIVEPVPNRVSQPDGELWMRVKYPTMPKRVDSVGRRSSSSSNLTNSDYYSNLAELQTEGNTEGSGTDSLGRRRHSFSEGEDRMPVRDSTVETTKEPVMEVSHRSLSDNRIDVTGGIEASGGNPDYKNLSYNPDGSLCMEPDDGTSFRDQIKVLQSAGPSISPCSYENLPATRGGEQDDYINDFPEGLDHVYSNQDDLLLQMQADNQPLPEEVEKALNSSRGRLGSGASILRFLNNFLKSKPSTIHSGTLSEAERDKTLAPFAISGIEAEKVNRDYEAFFTSAWGGKESVPKPAARSNEMASSTPNPISSVSELAEQAMSRSDRPTKQPPVKPSLPIPVSKPRSKTSGDLIEEHVKPAPPIHSPSVNKPLIAAATRRAPLLPPERPSHSRANQQVTTPPSSSNVQPLPPVRPHARLQASSSDATAIPRARLRDNDRSQSIEPPSITAATRHHKRPPVPPPPFQNSSQNSYHNSESQVQSLMPYWYKPKISREEAIAFVLPMSTGSFIVRDSSTVKGGYALTLKITEAIVRSRKKLASDDKVTDEMLVTHFLIQPDPMGVKLQGWSEKPFKSLTAFIASHVMEKMCLPCKLVLPDGGGGGQVTRRQPAGIAKAMQSGAACDLIFLGSVDVANPGSDAVLAQTVQQLQTLDLSSMNVVTITVSREGITLQEEVDGSYLRRQYPFNLVTYCGLDPTTRWNFPSLHHLGKTVTLTDKICFGIVHSPVNGYGHSCMVFAEYDGEQPVSSVVNFIQKMMREHKHSSKYVKT